MTMYNTIPDPAKNKPRQLHAVRDAIVPVLEQLEGRNLFSASVESFTLIDANTDQPLMTLSDGATLNLTTLPSRDLNIRANVTGGDAASVEFNIDGKFSSDISGPHFALAGEIDGDYQDWTPKRGFHTLTASAIDLDPEALDAPALTVTFNVVDRADAPGSFTATAASPTEVHLNWTDQADDETHYIIDRSTDGVRFHRIGSVAADSESFIDTHVIAPATVYHYRIKAVSKTLNSRWVSAVATTPAAPRPDAPSNVMVVPADSALDLSWSDNSSDETHFIIDRSIDGENFNRLGAVEADTTTFSDTWAEPGVTYTYRVKAVTTMLNSPWSAPATGTLPQVQNPTPQPEPEQRPTAPSDVLVEALSASQLRVSWQDNSSNELHFLVDRSIDGINWTRAASLPAGSGSFTDSNLAANTKYYYRVKAVGETLTSAWSATQSATTDSVTTPVADIAVVSFTLFNADTNQPIMTLANGGTIDFAAIGTRNVNVRANTSGAVGSVKFVYDGATFRTESSSPYAMAGDTGGAFNAWTPEVGAHTLKAMAYTGDDASGQLGKTHQVTFTVVEGEVVAPTAPAAPTSLAAAAASSSSVKLTWSESSSNESGFRIERSTDGVNFTQVASVGVNVKSYTNTGLNASTQYYFRVRAYNSVGTSDYTNVANATTSAATIPTTPGKFPDATTTGPTNRSILVERGSFNVTQEGAVIENFIVRNGGQIIISANNVTLRNFVIEDPQTTGAAIKIANSDVTGTVIEDGEIVGGTATNGVSGSNYTARRLHIHHLQADAFRVRVNVTIEGCYIHDIGIHPDSHGDGVQMYPTDGGNIRIIGNHIDARGGNAALFQVDGGWHIEGNYFQGGNYTIFCTGEPANKFINNTFARNAKYGPVRVGAGDREAMGAWTGNVWADTGEALNLV